MQSVQKKYWIYGFTIIELLVVIAIMGLMAGIGVPSFIVWRERQDISTAQRELVTNLQKARSFSLSGRRMTGNVSKYYALRVSTTNPTQYTLEGIAYNPSGSGDLVYDGASKPVLENWKLPGRVTISSISYERPAGTPQSTPTCLLFAFALPYGNTYIDTNNADGLDDDSACDFFSTYTDSGKLNGYANGKATITLSRPGGTLTKTVTVNGMTGQIQAN